MKVNYFSPYTVLYRTTIQSSVSIKTKIVYEMTTPESSNLDAGIFSQIKENSISFLFYFIFIGKNKSKHYFSKIKLQNTNSFLNALPTLALLIKFTHFFLEIYQQLITLSNQNLFLCKLSLILSTSITIMLSKKTRKHFIMSFVYFQTWRERK